MPKYDKQQKSKKLLQKKKKKKEKEKEKEKKKEQIELCKKLYDLNNIRFINCHSNFFFFFKDQTEYFHS